MSRSCDRLKRRLGTARGTVLHNPAIVGTTPSLDLQASSSRGRSCSA